VCIPIIVARQRLVKKALNVSRQRLGKNYPIVARQRLGRKVTAVTNIHATIEELTVGLVVFNVARVVSRKVGD
jgi:hypothetical protein